MRGLPPTNRALYSTNLIKCRIEPGAVHWHEVVRLNLLESLSRLCDECVGCRGQVDPTYNGVDLVDPSDRLDMLDRIDDAGMPMDCLAVLMTERRLASGPSWMRHPGTTSLTRAAGRWSAESFHL